MQTAIQNLGLSYDYFTNFPSDLNLYSSVFLCLGIYVNNHVLDISEGQILADYLNIGGCLYMEGGDTWFFDQQTPVHSMFNVDAIADGASDLGLLLGDSAAFTDGMAFSYSGDNNYIDRIDPLYPAFSIFTNQSPVYGSGVAYDQGNYKTVAASHEFGGLNDATFPSTKEELMAQYLEFFGLYTDEVNAGFYASTTTPCVGDTVRFYDNSTGNNFLWYWNFQGGIPSWSNLQNPIVVYYTPGTYDVELIVSDAYDIDTMIMQDYITVTSCGGMNSITGNVNYANSVLTPIDNTTLLLETLNGILIDSIVTNTSGAYSFSGINNTDCCIGIKLNKAWGGVNAADGLAIMRHFVGLSQLNGLPLVVSDVDASTFINTTDALMCVQRFVGMISSFPAGDWAYDQDTLNLFGGVIYPYNPMALCFGDADASHIPPAGKISPGMELICNEALYVKKEGIIELPLRIGRDLNIGAISLILDYPEKYLEFIDVDLGKSSLFEPVFNEVNGEIRLGWYDLEGINIVQNDNLLILKFRVKNLEIWPETGLELELNPSSELANEYAEPIRDLVIHSKKLIADAKISGRFILESNNPNPFTDKTQISFVIPEPAQITIKLYNLMGELVKIVYNNIYFDEGRNSIILNRDDLQPGVYLYKIDASGSKSSYSATRIMLII